MSEKNTVNAVHAEDSSSANVKPFYISDICSTSSGLIKIINSEGVSFLTRGEYFEKDGFDNLLAASAMQNCGGKPQGALNADALGVLLTAVRKYAAEKEAIAYLNRAEHSRFQLEIKLKKKGFSQEEVRCALDYLMQNGLLDDVRFARAWLNTRRISKKEGRIRLASELALRGVSFSIAQRAINDFFLENPEKEICCAALKRQTKKYSDKRKLLRSMQRLGFSIHLVNMCLEESKIIF